MVFYGHFTRYGIVGGETDVLIHFLDLAQSGVRLSVGIYEAINAEIFVVSVAECTIVAAIAPVFAAILVLHSESLVNPIPDESALKSGICADEVEKILEVARGVTHSVGELTHNVRACHPFAFAIVCNPFVGGGYIGHTISVFSPSPACSNCTGRVLSRFFIQW